MKITLLLTVVTNVKRMKINLIKRFQMKTNPLMIPLICLKPIKVTFQRIFKTDRKVLKYNETINLLKAIFEKFDIDFTNNILTYNLNHHFFFFENIIKIQRMEIIT